MSAFGDWRPMRPKPLMPTRAMVVIPPVAATRRLDAYVIGAPWDRLCADRLGHRGGLGRRGVDRWTPRPPAIVASAGMDEDETAHEADIVTERGGHDTYPPGGGAESFPSDGLSGRPAGPLPPAGGDGPPAHAGGRAARGMATPEAKASR